MENKNKCHLSQWKHYYLKSKLYIYETYTGRSIVDHIHDLKTRVNNHITESKG